MQRLAEGTFRTIGIERCFFTDAICIYRESSKKRPEGEGDCRKCSMPIVFSNWAAEIIESRKKEHGLLKWIPKSMMQNASENDKFEPVKGDKND